MSKAKGGITSLGTTLAFIKSGTCSGALIRSVDRAFDHPIELEENAANPLAGGLMMRGYQCGMIWGAVLAAGAQAYRLLGSGPQAEAGAIIAAQRIVESFSARNKHINCSEITGMKKQTLMETLRFFLKGGPIYCLRMAAKYAPIAFNEINTVFHQEHIEAPSPPLSCAAMLAKKMDASDMHTVMAAGFAGGIGLSGSGCGALGAAVWITGMNSQTEQGAKIDFKNSGVIAAVDRFVECTDSEFECSKIVGRKFENIDDHAAYLRDGGCSKIIEVLATE